MTFFLSTKLQPSPAKCRRNLLRCSFTKSQQQGDYTMRPKSHVGFKNETAITRNNVLSTLIQQPYRDFRYLSIDYDLIILIVEAVF